MRFDLWLEKHIDRFQPELGEGENVNKFLLAHADTIMAIATTPDYKPSEALGYWFGTYKDFDIYLASTDEEDSNFLDEDWILIGYKTENGGYQTRQHRVYFN